MDSVEGERVAGSMASAMRQQARWSMSDLEAPRGCTPAASPAGARWPWRAATRRRFAPGARHPGRACLQQPSSSLSAICICAHALNYLSTRRSASPLRAPTMYSRYAVAPPAPRRCHGRNPHAARVASPKTAAFLVSARRQSSLGYTDTDLH